MADRRVAAWRAANPASIHPILAHSAAIYRAARGDLDHPIPEIQARATGTQTGNFNRRFPELHRAVPAICETSGIGDARCQPMTMDASERRWPQSTRPAVTGEA
ncbi:MAG: hypothetical protein AAF402_10315 [Pseudomonadota bacterium]